MLKLRDSSVNIRFSGADGVGIVTNQQVGPTCGFEAIANLIELCRPEFAGRDLVGEDLSRRAQAYNLATPDGRLAFAGYQRILQHYGIASSWYPFDHYQVVLPALFNNLGVLVAGDASCLNATYPPNSSHAFVLTNFFTDEAAIHVGGYTGIDSNFPFRDGVFRAGQNYWPYQAVENAARWAAPFLSGRPVLITTTPINWHNKVRFYRTTQAGQFIAVPY